MKSLNRIVIMTIASTFFALIVGSTLLSIESMATDRNQSELERMIHNQLVNAYYEGTLEYQGREYKISGGGIVKTRDGKVAIMYVLGFPFQPPKKLAAEGEILKQVITIKIEKYDRSKGLLIPTEDSFVPLVAPDETINTERTSFTHAANVIWEFSKAGISFKINNVTYLSKKNGAKIIFTKEGVRLDGVEEKEKKK